jgi:hypothetical protein
MNFVKLEAECTNHILGPISTNHHRLIVYQRSVLWIHIRRHNFPKNWSIYLGNLLHFPQTKGVHSVPGCTLGVRAVHLARPLISLMPSSANQFLV